LVDGAAGLANALDHAVYVTQRTEIDGGTGGARLAAEVEVEGDDPRRSLTLFRGWGPPGKATPSIPGGAANGSPRTCE
jgi:hypothetical protein